MSQPVTERQLLTLREAAQVLRLSERQVRRLIAGGSVPAVQVGGRGHSIRIPEAALERLFADQENAA